MPMLRVARVRTVIAATLVLFAMVAGSAVSAADIKVLSSNPVKEPLLALATAFETSSGHKVVVGFGGTDALARRVSDGEAVDVVIVSNESIDRLIAAGKLASGSRADLAKVGVGIALRAGLPKPDVSSAEAVKQAVLAAKSVAYSSGPSGYYIVEMLRRMGIADQIKDKVKQPASGVQVGEMVARGEADLGFQQVTELVHVKGIDYLGPLPPEIQNITVYSAGLHGTASDAAKAFVRFITAPDAASVIRKSGMEPG